MNSDRHRSRASRLMCRDDSDRMRQVETAIDIAEDSSRLALAAWRRKRSDRRTGTAQAHTENGRMIDGERLAEPWDERRSRRLMPAIAEGFAQIFVPFVLQGAHQQQGALQV